MRPCPQPFPSLNSALDSGHLGFGFARYSTRGEPQAGPNAKALYTHERITFAECNPNATVAKKYTRIGSRRMVDVVNAEAVEANLEAAPEPLAMEGDFSRRKLKIAGGILIGQSFGTSILPYSALMLMLMPLTKQ